MRLNINSFNQILVEKGLKKDDICQITGLSKKSFDWILENQYIEISTLERIAEAIGCSSREISLSDYADVTENVIEWQRDSQKATVTICQKSMINKIRKLAEARPNECQIIAENKDNSIVAHIPRKWIKISPPKEVSDEQREISRQNMMKLLSKRGVTLDD